MSNTPLIPNNEDVLIIIDSLELLSDRIQDNIDIAEAEYYFFGDNSQSEPLDTSALSRQLEQVALVRGRMQPYLENILDEAPLSEPGSGSLLQE